MLALVAIAIVAVLLVRGCGDDSDRDAAAAQLEKTFGPGHPIDSGRLGLTLRVSGKGAGLDDGLDVTANGPFNTERSGEFPRFALELNTGGGPEATAGIVSTGTRGFVTVGDQAFRMTDSSYRDLKKSFAESQKRDQKARESAPGFSALGIRPSRWLTDATTLSDADVSGTPTQRVSGPLDVGALLDDIDTLLGRAGSLGQAAGAGKLPSGLDAETRAAIERSVTTANVTIDAGAEDDTLRRIALRLVLAVDPGDREALGGLEKLDLDLDLTISDLGRVEKIPEPKNAKPISALTAALSEISKSSGGGTGTTTTPAAPPTTTTTPQSAQDRYTQCLAAAGDDVAEIQKCAPLLER